jgi:predicted O-methyltransferase YrrM
MWIKRHSNSHRHSHRHRHTTEREREREREREVGRVACEAKGRYLRCVLKKTASKRKAGFSFASEAVLDTCKNRTKLAN